MKTIVFLNNKGGVGKTASTTTIVHMMATKFNKKVLLIDLDPQMNSSVMFSEIDFVSSIRFIPVINIVILLTICHFAFGDCRETSLLRGTK